MLKRLKNMTLPFQPHEQVVIVTKVKGPEQIYVERMLCLYKAAYNQFVNYDIVVITTISWTMKQVTRVDRIVAPARLIVLNKGPTLEGHLAKMTVEEIELLENRCGVNQTRKKLGLENLTWANKCQDGDHLTSLSYAWISEVNDNIVFYNMLTSWISCHSNFLSLPLIVYSFVHIQYGTIQHSEIINM